MYNCLCFVTINTHCMFYYRYNKVTNKNENFVCHKYNCSCVILWTLYLSWNAIYTAFILFILTILIYGTTKILHLYNISQRYSGRKDITVEIYIIISLHTSLIVDDEHEDFTLLTVLIYQKKKKLVAFKM